MQHVLNTIYKTTARVNSCQNIEYCQVCPDQLNTNHHNPQFTNGELIVGKNHITGSQQLTIGVYLRVLCRCFDNAGEV